LRIIYKIEEEEIELFRVDKGNDDEVDENL
jgi:hypothetical protein